MAKPTEFPDFASDIAQAEITEPSASKKESGWEGGEEPPHEFFNWLHNLYGSWIRWLEETVESIAVSITGIESSIAGIDTRIDEIEEKDFNTRYRVDIIKHQGGVETTVSGGYLGVCRIKNMIAINLEATANVDFTSSGGFVTFKVESPDSFDDSVLDAMYNVIMPSNCLFALDSTIQNFKPMGIDVITVGSERRFHLAPLGASTVNGSRISVQYTSTAGMVVLGG